MAGNVNHFFQSRDSGQTLSPPFAICRHPDRSVGAAIGLTQLTPQQTGAVIMEITHTDASFEGFKAPRKSRTRFAWFDPHTAAVKSVSVLPQPPETLVGAMSQKLVTLRKATSCCPRTSRQWIGRSPRRESTMARDCFAAVMGGKPGSPFTRIFGPHPTRPEIFYNDSKILEKADVALVAFARYDNAPPPRERGIGKVVSRDAGHTWIALIDSEFAAICRAQLRLPRVGYLMSAGALDEPLPRT